LFEVNIPPLQVQKNHRELEIIVQECILNTLRESIPVEAILKAYMDETIEEDVTEEVKEEIISEPIKQQVVAEAQGIPLAKGVESITSENDMSSRLSFNDVDEVKSTDGTISSITAPKDVSTLEQISQMRNEQRKNELEEDDDNVKLTISDQTFSLDALDVHNIEEPKIDLLPDLLIDDIEVLDDF
jgi:hypothetical protein